MKNKSANAAKLGALLCVPLVVLAGVPTAQRYKAQRQAHAATSQLSEKLSGSLDAGPASVEELVVAGADVNHPCSNGYKPLHWAVQRKSLSEARLLLDNGADINAGDGWHETALSKAARSGSTDFVRFLLKRDAKVNARALSTYTALSSVQKALSTRRAKGEKAEHFVEIIQLLKAAGAKA